MEKEGFWFEWSIQVITEAQKVTACYTITVVIFENSIAGTVSDQFRLWAVLIRMQTQGKGAQNFLSDKRIRISGCILQSKRSVNFDSFS